MRRLPQQTGCLLDSLWLALYKSRSVYDINDTPKHNHTLARGPKRDSDSD